MSRSSYNFFIIYREIRLWQYDSYHLSVVYSRVNLTLRVVPNTVQVRTCQIATSRPIDNSVRVEHRNNLEDEIVAENFSIKRGASEVVQDSLHYPRSS
jgi:NDP-sugar pyrophosphorylase family protein